MLEFVRIPVGTGRELRCSLCDPAQAPTYLPAEQVAASIAEAARHSGDPTGPNLCLCGPEPLGHPDLPRLVLSCRQAGARRIALETDGAALSIPSNVAGLLSAGVHHLHVRVLDADEARGDRLGGRPGKTRDALAGAAAFAEAARAAGIATVLTLRVPVCPHNLASLTGVVLQAASMHADAVRLLSPGALPPSAGTVLAAACDTGMVNGVWVEAADDLPLPETHRLHVVQESLV